MHRANYDLILTRPLPRSKEFAAALPSEILAKVTLHFAPVIAIRRTRAHTDLSGYAGVIFSSASAVGCVDGVPGMPAYCVGARTTQDALDAGFAAKHVGDTADELVNALITTPPATPLLHLHGEHTRGAVSERLISAGLETKNQVVYAQDAQDMPRDIVEMIMGGRNALVPLFSPRSAALFCDQIQDPPNTLKIIALSQAVADAVPGDWPERPIVVKAPNVDEMRIALSRVISG